LPIKAVPGVVALTLAVALAGCGGGSSSADKTSSAKPAAVDSATVEKLLEQTFGPNPAASSGLLSGTINIDVNGVARFKQRISLA